jgi:hypothetical protein
MRMKSQKLLAAVISAAIIFGTSVPAAADTVIKNTDSVSAEQQQTKLTKDEAKNIAKAKFKEYLNYVVDESKLEASVNLSPYYSYPDNYTWMIYWNSSDQKKGINLQAVIDANTGKVLSLRKNEYDNTKKQSSIPAITYENAKKSAESYLGRVFPDKVKDTKLSANGESSHYKGYIPLNYNFNYQRTINGIGFEGNYVNIDVDGITGKVIGFDLNWIDDLKLPASGTTISKTKAEELLRKNLSLEMNYFTYVSKYSVNGQEPTTKLGYNISGLSSLALDAVSGEIVNYSNGSNSKILVKDATDQEKQELYKDAVVTAPLTKEMSKVEAEAAIKAKLKELFSEEYQIKHLSYNENTSGKEVSGSSSWSANYSKNINGSMIDSGSISIDSLTGGILYLYSYDSEMKEGSNFIPKLSWEEAYYKALKAAAKYFPDKIKNIDMKQTHITSTQAPGEASYVERQYYFSFPRTVNGIKYPDNNISISVDAKTGSLQQMSAYWTSKITFASTDGTISTADAQNRLLTQYKPELIYVMLQKDNFETTNNTVKLIYRLANSENSTAAAYMDAFTGKYLDYSGEEIIKLNKNFFAAIKGAKYENELTILAYQGILDTNSFNMNKQVTRMDLIKMLVDAKGYRPYVLSGASALKYSNVTRADSNYSYLQMAVYYGFLENKEGVIDLNEKVTREEMAKSLVMLLGYGDLAKITSIFKVNAKDSLKLDKNYTGYVAIAEGLGILKVEKDNIRPKNVSTSLELALGVYEVLGNLRSSMY